MLFISVPVRIITYKKLAPITPPADIILFLKILFKQKYTKPDKYDEKKIVNAPGKMNSTISRKVISIKTNLANNIITTTLINKNINVNHLNFFIISS